MNKNYAIISHDMQIHSALKHIEQYDHFAFDTETTGLNVRKDKVIGMSFSGKVGTAFYIARYTWDTEKEELVECVSEHYFRIALEKLVEKELLMWNASYDVRIVQNDLGIDLRDSLSADIMLMKHAINEEGVFGLKTVAVEYQQELGMDMESAANEEQIALKENVAKNGGSTTRSNYEMLRLI